MAWPMKALKWWLIQFSLIGSGLAIGLTGVSRPVGLVLLMLGGFACIGWRTNEDFERGWPPWPFSDMRRNRR
jgi:hypothetical protein